ncbi:related to Glycerophosphodiester phosphodiesterase GDE1 [Zygosaccharomyces bailii ISA1307]|nr:related to Glycerophosphodiester phosphodiesterase GDE1 [Zygosaccharomyces bailii ISA1307]
MKFGKTFPNHQVPQWSHQYVNYKGLKKLIKEITQEQEKLYRQDHEHLKTRNSPPGKVRDSSKVEENYMDNEGVKKLLAFFFFALDRDIEKVDNFYNMQFSEYERRLRRLTSSAQFAEINNSLMTQSGISLVPQGMHHPRPEINGLNPNYVDQMQSSQSMMPTMSQTPEDISEDLAEVLGILVELRSRFRNLKWYGELNKRAFTKILKKLDKKVGTNQQHIYLQARILPLGFSNDSEIVRCLNVINDVLDKVSFKVQDKLASGKKVAEKEIGGVELKNGGPPNDIILYLIEKNDGIALINELTAMYRSLVLIPTRILVNLLNKAALSQSFQCMDELLKIIPTLRDPSDINARNFFHHHVIALGKNHKKLREDTAYASVKANGALQGSVRNEENLDNMTNLNSLLKETLDLEAAELPDHNSRLIGAFGPDGINSNDSPASLVHILDKLPAHLRPSLLQRDNYKRTPLHYSAQYGLVEVTRIIVENLKKWGAWNADISIDNTSIWGDSENLTPLHLAVIGSHPQTVKTLLSYVNHAQPVTCPQLLHLATRLNSGALVEALLSAKGFDLNFPDEDTCETPLYLACKLNLYEAATCLLEHGADTELREKLFGWTPIFVAATEGYERIVQLLLDHGTEYVVFDESGWTPMEHAALRGHLKITAMLKITGHPGISHPKIPSDEVEAVTRGSPPSESVSSPASRGDSTSSSISGHNNENLKGENQSSIEHKPKNGHVKINHRELLRSSTARSNSHHKHHAPLPQPVKSFGHRYLDHDESLLMITLGGNDSRNTKPAVSLNKVPVSKVSSTQLDTALSLVITCIDDLSETPFVLDLPLDDNLDAVTFKVPSKANESHVVLFDIVPTYGSVPGRPSESPLCSGNSHAHPYPADPPMVGSGGSLSSNNTNGGNTAPRVVGRAVALLSKTGAFVGVNRRSLNDVITVPIVANGTMDVLGTVSFEHVMVTAFDHPKMSVGRTETYWKSLVSTRVIGHRGLGKNFSSKKSLQLGENTVESFIAAASLGASYVEFDVQLTKDNIPVVYHDFLVAETGVDIPMHELTLEQFLDLNNVEGHMDVVNRKDRRRSVDDTETSIYKTPFDDSLAKSGAHEDVSKLLENRMRLTRTYKKNNFKGNFRGHSIASSFVTLKELFKKIPQNVGFNIECKYPMADEAEQEDIGQIAVEMNHWVDTVLKVVYDNANGRDIIFSSFHPDVCVMLSLKQPSIPILFLTEAGTTQMADVRASSLQNAVRFARSWNLLGIVSAAAPIIQAPRLAQVVKSSGLVCVTYGVENNDPENASIEMDAGVDAVIVDSVLAIRKELTKANVNVK